MIKNEYHHGNLKEEFLRIAFDFISKNDVEELTLKILSDATGTSRSAIYRHFASKDALIESMIREGFVLFDKELSPILGDKDKPLVERFYEGGKEYIEFAKKHPNLYRLLFGKKYSHIRDSIMTIKDEDCSGFAALKKAVEEGQVSGLLKKEDPFERTILIWANLHGLASIIIDGFMDVDQISEHLYDTMFQDMLSACLANKIKVLSKLPFLENMLKPGS